MESILFWQKKEAKKTVGYGILEQKTRILQEVGKKINALESRLMVRSIEDRQTMVTYLQEIKDLVAVNLGKSAEDVGCH